MSDRTALGSHLYHQRIFLDKSREQLARKLKVPAETLAKWESGDNIPSEEMLPRLARVYKLGEEELISLRSSSKDAQADERACRKSLFKKTGRGKAESDLFGAGIGKMRSIVRTNFPTYK